jgi:hypothetical protein
MWNRTLLRVAVEVYCMVTADVDEFTEQRNKLLGDRKRVTAVGKYIIELYTDPMGQRPRTVIEVNQKTENGEYEKVESVWFNTLEAETRTFSDPEDAAYEAFDEMSKSTKAVESYL